jgi:preprotein translocase subunit SecA
MPRQKKEKLFQDFRNKKANVFIRLRSIKSVIFEKDNEYVIMDNKSRIVDEQTGRIDDGRRYSDGLHQADSFKEKLSLQTFKLQAYCKTTPGTQMGRSA